jgi:hypothetical protein
MVASFLTFSAPVGGRADTLAVPQGKIKSIFGITKDSSYFKGKDTAEIVRMAKDLGVNAVFGCHEDQKLTKAFQRAGIFVYAEIGLFGDAKRWKDHPEARPITAEGKPIEKDRWYGGLCPNQEWLRKEKLALMKKHVAEQGVDGVWLDFIRYACHWEVKEPRMEQNCFCPVCLELFEKETGLRMPAEKEDTKAKADWILSTHKDKWTQFKCERINSFVKESRDIIKKANPRAVVGLFGVPWLKSDYDNAIKEIIAQDYKALGRWVDVFSPMCYHDMCGRNTGWIATVSKEISRITGKPCVPIVQVAEISSDEFAKALHAAVADPSKGVIVFNWRHLKKEDKLPRFRALEIK